MASARFLDPASIPLKRQSGGNIWATLVTVTQGLTVVVALAGLALFFLPVIQKTHQYQDEQQEIRIETEHMKTDPAYVEHIARDRLQMGKEGEEIVHFPPYQPTPPASNVARPKPQDDSDR